MQRGARIWTAPPRSPTPARTTAQIANRLDVSRATFYWPLVDRASRHLIRTHGGDRNLERREPVSPRRRRRPGERDAYRAKLDALAGTIAALDPDVLALQEIGDPEALDDLVERLEGGWRTAVSGLPDRRGIRVAFLWRQPLGEVEQVGRFPTPLAPVQVADDGNRRAAMGRGALRVRARLENTTVELVTCHLKSKLLSFPGERFQPRDEGERARYGAYALNLRGAEAVTVRALADRLLDGHGHERAVVVLGDLNDEPDAATTQLLLGPPGSEIGTPGEQRPDQGDGMRLWNLAPRLPPERAFSRVYRGRRELIDHILVSRALLERTQHITTSSEEVPSIEDDPGTRRDASASDHAPVVARIDR